MTAGGLAAAGTAPPTGIAGAAGGTVEGSSGGGGGVIGATRSGTGGTVAGGGTSGSTGAVALAGTGGGGATGSDETAPEGDEVAPEGGVAMTGAASPLPCWTRLCPPFASDGEGSVGQTVGHGSGGPTTALPTAAGKTAGAGAETGVDGSLVGFSAAAWPAFTRVGSAEDDVVAVSCELLEALAIAVVLFPLLLSERLQGPARAANPPNEIANPPASHFHRACAMMLRSSINAMVGPLAITVALARAPFPRQQPIYPTLPSAVSADSSYQQTADGSSCRSEAKKGGLAPHQSLRSEWNTRPVRSFG